MSPLRNHDYLLSTPIPKLQLQFFLDDQQERITKIKFIGRRSGSTELERHTRNCSLIEDVTQQINAYFNLDRQRLSFPYVLNGTKFQIRVWRALLAIDLGCTVTYGQLAEQLQTSARAIGGACRANPLPLIIPCHRVVSRLGLGGFVGQEQGLFVSAKEWIKVRVLSARYNLTYLLPGPSVVNMPLIIQGNKERDSENQVRKSKNIPWV